MTSKVAVTTSGASVFDKGIGLLLGTLAHDQAAVRRYCRVVPQIASHLCLIALTPLLLFFTKLHCSSHTRTFGVRPRTC